MDIVYIASSHLAVIIFSMTCPARDLRRYVRNIGSVSTSESCDVGDY